MKRILLIDDLRTIADIQKKWGETVSYIATSYESGMEQLTQHGPWDILFLDHDIASFIDGKEKTGYDIMNFLENNTQYLPKEIVFVTDNPTGLKNMRLALSAIRRRMTQANK